MGSTVFFSRNWLHIWIKHWKYRSKCQTIVIFVSVKKLAPQTRHLLQACALPKSTISPLVKILNFQVKYLPLVLPWVLAFASAWFNIQIFLSKSCTSLELICYHTRNVPFLAYFSYPQNRYIHAYMQTLLMLPKWVFQLKLQTVFVLLTCRINHVYLCFKRRSYENISVVL